MTALLQGDEGEFAVGARRVLALGLPVAVLAIAGALCLSGVPSRVCERLNHWFVWGTVALAPPSETGRAFVPVDASEAVAVSGVIRYENGHLRTKRQSELPLRRVEVGAGGLSVRIEDAGCSPIGGSRSVAEVPGSVLVASIWGWFDAGHPRPIDYRYYHFRPGEPVELELDFCIIATPVPDTGGGRFSLKLGTLEASGERRWNEIDGVWEPLVRMDHRIRVETVMVHWREGAQYASVSLDGIDVGGDFTVRGREQSRWSLQAAGNEVACVATVTGAADAGPGR